jgi:hypothetical protein
VLSAHTEPGGSWRPFWAAAAVLAVLAAALAALGVPALPVVLVVLAVLGVLAAGVLSARRAWTVRIGRDDDGAPVLSVGRERVPLADVDPDHLRAVRAGRAGVDAGAPVLGGGWSPPRGRTGLPLRLRDGRTLLVPTRDPAALSAALLDALGRAAGNAAGHAAGNAVGDTPRGGTGGGGTLGA